MLRLIRKLHRDDQGQDMIEYALLAAFISIAAIATVKLIGPLIVILYGNIQTALT